MGEPRTGTGFLENAPVTLHHAVAASRSATWLGRRTTGRTDTPGNTPASLKDKQERCSQVHSTREQASRSHPARCLIGSGQGPGAVRLIRSGPSAFTNEHRTESGRLSPGLSSRQTPVKKPQEPSARRSRDRRPTCIDIFAGAGGLSEGFRQAGFRIAAAMDRSGAAARTFQQNFPEAAFCTTPANELSGDQLPGGRRDRARRPGLPDRRTALPGIQLHQHPACSAWTEAWAFCRTSGTWCRPTPT